MDWKRADRVEPARRDVGDGEVVALVEAVGEREPRSRRIDIVVPALLQHFPLERALALRTAIDCSDAGATGHGADAAGVLVAARRRRDGAAAIHPQRTDGQRVGSQDLIELQDIDGGKPGQRGGIDDEEESPCLVIEIPSLAIERLARHVAHRVEPILHDVALLLRDDPTELERTDLRDRLHTEIVRGDRRRDEARRRRLERHVARFDPAQDLVLQPLVPDVQVVVGVELPLAVEIHVDMQPLADDAARADRILRIRRDRRESGVASRERRLLLLRGAAQVAELVRLELQPKIQVHPKLRGNRGRLGKDRGGWWRLWRNG